MKPAAPLWFRMARMRGFTLTEALVVLAIASVMAAATIPSYQWTVMRNRVAGEVNALSGDFQFARAEAIKQGQTVTICPSSSGTSCSGTSAWSSGWIVFVDPTGSGSVPSGTTPLRVQTALTGGDTMAASNLSGSFLSFNREGFAIGVTAPSGLFTVHDSSAAFASCLSITVVGQISVLPKGGSCT